MKVLPLFVLVALTLTVVGCGGGGEAPATTPDNPAAIPGSASGEAPAATPEGGIAPAPGAGGPSTGYTYRFRMTSPANDNFAITEREVYLWFWPDTTKVLFRLENRLGTQMRILWDECRFTTAEGITFRTIHQGITYEKRNLPQNYQIVPGLGRYNDWIAHVDLLDDPNAAAGGEMRKLFPTDVSAMSFVGKQFSIRFVLEIENVPRTYNLVFEVENVSPPS